MIETNQPIKPLVYFGHIWSVSNQNRVRFERSMIARAVALIFVMFLAAASKAQGQSGAVTSVGAKTEEDQRAHEVPDSAESDDVPAAGLIHFRPWLVREIRRLDLDHQRAAR